uniref:NADH dehydrogenase subunit 6 n=1 Tax=Diostrombus politus TaxID=130564 RepID=UPI002A83909A|nr:NADH dehydrogenase subunit 6 [Diostrombus politus]WOW99045.1 NADH dehydrogenase subunit 6 [Diostrombus politus]
MKLSYIMISTSLITPMLSHPISLGFTMIMQTMLLCLNMSIYSETSWYSYILFITIIGGMMIMFMYMASIASNEKFKLNKFLIPTMLISLTSMTLMEILDFTLEYPNNMKEMKMTSLTSPEMKSTMKFFNMNKGMITMMMIISLLITMIAVTNISSTFEGPLKKTYV